MAASDASSTKERSVHRAAKSKEGFLLAPGDPETLVAALAGLKE